MPLRTTVTAVLIDIVLLVLGLAVMTWAAEEFVSGAARLAASLDISPVIVGAVVVGFGTSAPELVASGLASNQGQPELALGNVIGSNIANISLVLAAAALIVPLGVSAVSKRREAPISVASVLAFAVVANDGITTTEGAILAVAIVVVLAWLIRAGHAEETDPELAELLDGEASVASDLRQLGVGLVLTVIAAQAVVWAATGRPDWLIGETDGIAGALGLSGGFVGLTIVALGTSLPELVTAIVAARKGETELIVGNLLGSNVFNSLAVGAVIGLLGPGTAEGLVAGWGLVVMVGVVLLSWAMLVTGSHVLRWQAAVLLAVYLACLPILGAQDRSSTEASPAHDRMGVSSG